MIDAIFGSGLNRPVTGLAARIIKQMNASANRVVAVDIPSGLAGEDNTWNDPETIVCAEYTFTFQFPKLAFMLAENEKYVGRWEVLDIGLHPEIIARQPTDWFYTTEDTVKAILPPSPVFAHKGTNGKGLLIAGSYGMMGAAVLGAKAAVRSGIGLLYCHIPGKGIEVIQTTVPEAIPDPDESAERFSAVCKLRDYDAIAVGPAIGQGPETVGGLEKLLRTWRGTTILDADALNIIAEHRELLDLLHEGCILTPHMKEFERLAGKSVNDFERLNKLSIFANHVVVTNNEIGDQKSYLIPFGSRITVKEGQEIKAGTRITEGSVNPHDVLAISGTQAVQDYLIQEVQRVYRMQGVDINDKHIEVIVRQMMKKVRIDEAGDTSLLPSSLVDKSEMEAENRAIRERIEAGETELREATYTPVLLGITKASLATDSFLSAASFQETTRVLTDAAIKGKVDPLLGLKENVIIGKLVPAGTGMKCYSDVEIESTNQVLTNDTI